MGSMTGGRAPACPLLLLLLLVGIPALHADPEHHYLVKPKGEPGYQLLKLEKPLDMESINKDLGVAKKASELAADTGDAVTEEAAADAADTDATDTADEAALDADILAAEEEEGDIIEEDADTDNEGDYMNEGQLDDEVDEDEYEWYDDDDDEDDDDDYEDEDDDEKELKTDAGQLDIAEGLKSMDEFFEEDGEAGSDYMDGDGDSHNGETVEYYLIP